MAYTTNPYLPRVRMSAVKLVRQGWSVRKTARYVGVHPGTVSKWVHRAGPSGAATLPTQSSRPHTHPQRIPPSVERAIVDERLRTKRCGQVIHHVLRQRGIPVSLSTVHRVLDRYHLTKAWSPWKRRHLQTPRPSVHIPGDLLECDTIHHMATPSTRLYVYALIDCASRWAYAWASERITVWRSLAFVHRASTAAPFSFQMLQTDHGTEFSQHFSERVGIPHRHIHIRSPNENGHVERFNRTIQEECLVGLPRNPRHYNAAIIDWLTYYNTERPHMGIDYLTPMEKLQQLFPRS